MRNPTDAWSVRVSRRARRLSVRVYPGGRVEIVAPPGASANTVQRFIGEHRRWIDERVRDFATSSNVTADLPEALELKALDRNYRIEYVDRPGALRIELHGPDRLLVRGTLKNRHAVAKALRGWLTQLAVCELGRQLQTLAARFDFRYLKVQIRRQRTRWGSCSVSGTISLNVCLLFLEPAITRYLMIHELCHTRQMNHSPRFWNLVAECEPNYRSLDRALTRSWRQVPWWMFG
jgi:predicted metal-dependent hydrolase